MLKFLFLSLLAANGLLFAFQQGHLEPLIPSGREPLRIANQLNADKIKLTGPPASAASAGAAAGAAPALAAADHKQNLPACIEIGNFTIAEARRFETQLAHLALAAKPARREVQESSSSHMIFIPPQGGKEGADRRAAELRNSGITDFYVIQENSDQRWGISLGVFKSEEAARAHLGALNQKGIRNARLATHQVALNKVVFQLHGLDPGARKSVDKIKSGFPRQEVRMCD
jgi:cell division septation protein DedD